MKDLNLRLVTKVQDHPNDGRLVVVTWGKNIYSVAEKSANIQVGDEVIEFEREYINFHGLVSEAKILEVKKNEQIDDGVRSSEGESGEDPGEGKEGYSEWETEGVSSEDTSGSMGDGVGEEINWDPDQY